MDLSGSLIDFSWIFIHFIWNFLGSSSDLHRSLLDSSTVLPEALMLIGVFKLSDSLCSRFLPSSEQDKECVMLWEEGRRIALPRSASPSRKLPPPPSSFHIIQSKRFS